MQLRRYYLAAAALFVFVLAAAVYAPGLYGPFVFDDLTNILQVPGIRIADLSYDSLHTAWNARAFDGFIGRPLAMLSFAANYYFGQFDVFHFKLTNLLIHLLVGMALFVLTLLLLRRLHAVHRNVPYAPQHLPWLALAIASVWLVHPLNLTSVLYVVQRMTSLSTLCMVLGLIGYCHGREQILRGNKTGFITIPVAVSAAAAVGMLFKENAVLILPLAIVIELAFYRLAAHARLAVSFRRFWFVFILLPVVIAVAVVLVQHERWFGAGAYRFRDFTLEERVLTQGRVLWFYLRLILLPDISRMGLYHDDFAISHGLLSPWTTLPALIGIALLLANALIYRSRFPVLFFAVAWFLVGHSMESSVLPLEMIHEHRNYLPQYGVLFGIIYAIAAPYARLQTTLRWRVSFLALFAALLAVCTYQRSLQWESEFSLYTREVINHPQSVRAQTMLGAWLHAYGPREDALRHLATAVELAGKQADPMIRLVQHLYATTGNVPPSLFEELRKRLTEGPISPVTAWVYEPLLRVARDDPPWHDRFIDLYAATISRPDVRFAPQRYEAAYRLLAENYALRGRTDVALRYYAKARHFNPLPHYDIAAASLYADNACYRQAETMITALRERGQQLQEQDQERLKELEAKLDHGARGDSRCTL